MLLRVEVTHFHHLVDGGGLNNDTAILREVQALSKEMANYFLLLTNQNNLIMNALEQAKQKADELQVTVDDIQSRLKVSDAEKQALLDAANANIAAQAEIIAALRAELSAGDTAALALVDQIESTNADLKSTLDATPVVVVEEPPTS